MRTKRRVTRRDLSRNMPGWNLRKRSRRLMKRKRSPKRRTAKLMKQTREPKNKVKKQSKTKKTRRRTMNTNVNFKVSRKNQTKNAKIKLRKQQLE
jgi:hypothetical protein